MMKLWLWKRNTELLSRLIQSVDWTENKKYPPCVAQRGEIKNDGNLKLGQVGFT